ncbi:MAG TPA: hypothetical protein VMG09_13505 [Bacteroidota bacterium]|nr:hypothetical protein [Bacteroidota bacterium]
MGTGQTLLTILALALLGSLFLTNNRNTLDQRQAIESAEWEIVASSLATSIVEKATSLSFDQHTITGDVYTPNDLSTTLGPDGTEGTTPGSDAKFNDIDDYNGFQKTVSGDTLALPTANFLIKVKVQYVNLNLGTSTIDTSSVKTYHKRLTVWVTSPSMNDTVSYQTVYSYWYFR